jgi:hypothetical protein
MSTTINEYSTADAPFADLAVSRSCHLRSLGCRVDPEGRRAMSITGPVQGIATIDETQRPERLSAPLFGQNDASALVEPSGFRGRQGSERAVAGSSGMGGRHRAPGRWREGNRYAARIAARRPVDGSERRVQFSQRSSRVLTALLACLRLPIRHAHGRPSHAERHALDRLRCSVRRRFHQLPALAHGRRRASLRAGSGLLASS